MISTPDLRKISRQRLADADALLNARRYDGALYPCGYAVEIALKQRICRTLDWPRFPESRKEFQGLENLRTHNLDLLLKLSGVERRVKEMLLTDWSLVADAWDPEVSTSSAGFSPVRMQARCCALRGG